MKGDLIERVHGAVANYCGHTGPTVNERCGTCDSITSAAITVVAEWLDDIGKHTAAAELRAAKEAA